MKAKLIYFPIVLLLLLVLAACGGIEEDPLVSQGRQLFTANCAACHSLEAEVILVGPSMAGIAERADENELGLDARDYLQESILEPAKVLTPGFTNMMPPVYGQSLSTEDLEAVIAFLMTLE